MVGGPPERHVVLYICIHAHVHQVGSVSIRWGLWRVAAAAHLSAMSSCAYAIMHTRLHASEHQVGYAEEGVSRCAEVLVVGTSIFRSGLSLEFALGGLG